MANIRPGFFVRGRLRRSKLAGLVIAGSVSREGGGVVRLKRTFVTFPNNAKALRRVTRMVSGISLGRLSTPYVLCGLGNCCSSLGTLLGRVVRGKLSSGRQRGKVCFTRGLNSVGQVLGST